MTDATVGSLIDNRVGELEIAICDILGIPLETNMNAPALFHSAAGLLKIFLQNGGVDPTIVGEIVRNGTRIKTHDGAAIQDFAYQSDIFIGGSVEEPEAVNTADEFPLYSVGIGGGSLGTAGFLHISVETFINSMLTGSSLQIRVGYGGAVFYGPTLFNGSGGTVGPFGVRTDVRLSARNSALLQVFSAVSVIGQDNPLVNWGASGHFSYHRAGLLSISSGSSQALAVNALWSLADPFNSVSGLGLDIWKTR